MKDFFKQNKLFIAVFLGLLLVVGTGIAVWQFKRGDEVSNGVDQKEEEVDDEGSRDASGNEEDNDGMESEDETEVEDREENISSEDNEETVNYVNPDEYEEKENLVDNDDDYTVWLIDVEKVEDRANLKHGRFLIELKDIDGQENAVLIDGKVELFGSASIRSSFEEGRYLLITAGTYTSQGGYALDLKKGEIIDEICLDTGGQFYHKGYIYYTNCDLEPEVKGSVGSGESPSVVQLNVNTHESKVLYQSDELQDFKIMKIEDSTLYVKRGYVEAAEDWATMDSEKIFTETIKRDL